jgi:hypothetical protein
VFVASGSVGTWEVYARDPKDLALGNIRESKDGTLHIILVRGSLEGLPIREHVDGCDRPPPEWHLPKINILMADGTRRALSPVASSELRRSQQTLGAQSWRGDPCDAVSSAGLARQRAP